MSKDMKLIMEGWRQYSDTAENLNELELGKAAKKLATGQVGQIARDITGKEKQAQQLFGADFDPEVDTVGDLKKAIQAMRSAAAGEEVGKLAVSTLMDLAPGIGNLKAVFSNVKDSAAAIKQLYGAGEIKTNTNLDLMQMDPDISKIIDDPVEVAYLNDLIQRMGDDDTTRLSQFLNGGTIESDLQNWLASNFNNFTIKK
jgi:hypothetical protein